MKWLCVHQLGKASRGLVAGALLLGLVGCSTLPIPISSECLSFDTTKEVWAGLQEPPAVESALDRVNTAARIIEIGDLIIHTLPISGGSEWPKKVGGSVPFDQEASLKQRLQQDPAYYNGAAGQSSALKLKEMYLQTVLFNRYPEVYAPRRMGAAVPAEAEVNALGAKVLGTGYSPAFTKVFYRFLQYNPAFEPKADLFSGRMNGKATEVYPSLLDAVVSLAENKPEIIQLQESVLQAEEKKAKERRDILDLSQRIQKLEAVEFGNPSTADEAVQASDKDTNAKEVEDLKGQLAVQEVEFKTTVKAYKEELEKLGLEMAKIKTQAVAFSPEQRALAANIQTAVDAVQGTLCQAEILLGIAGYHMKKALPNVKTEIRTIANQGSQAASERIKRITLNLAALPTNLSVLTIELGVLHEDAEIYDDLFKSRVTVDTSGGSAGGSDWLAWLRGW